MHMYFDITITLDLVTSPIALLVVVRLINQIQAWPPPRTPRNRSRR
jgi:hypothetical protein